LENFGCSLNDLISEFLKRWLAANGTAKARTCRVQLYAEFVSKINPDDAADEQHDHAELLRPRSF
jgi:hypothetical protein